MSFTAQYVFPNKLQPKIHSPEIDAEKLLEKNRAGKGGEEQKEKVGGRRERRYRMEGKEDGEERERSRTEEGVRERGEGEEDIILWSIFKSEHY